MPLAPGWSAATRKGRGPGDASSFWARASGREAELAVNEGRWRFLFAPSEPSFGGDAGQASVSPRIRRRRRPVWQSCSRAAAPERNQVGNPSAPHTTRKDAERRRNPDGRNDAILEADL